MSRVWFVFLATVATGCSNQQAYNAVQDAQKIECQKYPDTRYEECMARLDMPYDDYEASRRTASDE